MSSVASHVKWGNHEMASLQKCQTHFSPQGSISGPFPKQPANLSIFAGRSRLVLLYCYWTDSKGATDTFKCKEIISCFTASKRTIKVKFLCEKFEPSRYFICGQPFFQFYTPWETFFLRYLSKIYFSFKISLQDIFFSEINQTSPHMALNNCQMAGP